MPIRLSWGTTLAEQRQSFPCDRFIDQFDEVFYRSVTVQAQREVVFRWLCQMRVAPYSYDWINNLGRRSPRVLTQGAEGLETGQRMMRIFDVVAFEKDRNITLRVRENSFWEKWFGHILLSYVVQETSDVSCRLLVKIYRRYHRNLMGLFMRYFLPWANLIMHRKQLLLFKKLAEQGGNPATSQKS